MHLTMVLISVMVKGWLFQETTLLVLQERIQETLNNAAVNYTTISF